MTAFDDALARAAAGLSWSYPCLVWVADYLKAETGRDPAESWRHVEWDEARAKHLLARLGAAGEGGSAVERALDAIAKREGWREAYGPEQGAVMIGVYTDPAGVGFPAIFDGWRGWLICYFGAATILRDRPERIWEIAR